MQNLNEYLKENNQKGLEIMTEIQKTENKLQELLNQDGMEVIKALLEKHKSLSQQYENHQKADYRNNYFVEGIKVLVNKSIKDKPLNNDAMYKNGHILFSDMRKNPDFKADAFFRQYKTFFAFYLTRQDATEQDKQFINELASYSHSSVYELCELFDDKSLTLRSQTENISFNDVLNKHLPDNIKINVLYDIKNRHRMATNKNETLGLSNVYNKELFAIATEDLKKDFFEETLYNIYRTLVKKYKIDELELKKLNEMLKTKDIKIYLTENNLPNTHKSLKAIEEKLLKANYIADSVLDETEGMYQKPEFVDDFFKSIEEVFKTESLKEKETDLEI